MFQNPTISAGLNDKNLERYPLGRIQDQKELRHVETHLRGCRVSSGRTPSVSGSTERHCSVQSRGEWNRRKPHEAIKRDRCWALGSTLTRMSRILPVFAIGLFATNLAFSQSVSEVLQSTELAASIDSSSTVIPVTNGAPIVAPALATIDDEVLSVCQVSGNDLIVGTRATCPSILGRAVERSTPTSHYVGTSLHLRNKVVGHAKTSLETAPIANPLATKVSEIGAIVTAYGADPKGIRDSLPAFIAASAASATIFVPDGNYLMLDRFQINRSNFAMICASQNAVIEYGGVTPVDSVLMIGPNVNFDVLVENCSFRGDAGGHVTRVINLTAANHTSLKHISLKDAHICLSHLGGVGNTLDELSCSVNNGGFRFRPTLGLEFDGIPGTNTPGTTTNIIRPIIEGIDGTGIQFRHSESMNVLGGTSEANRLGIAILDNSAYGITIDNFGLEANCYPGPYPCVGAATNRAVEDAGDQTTFKDGSYTDAVYRIKAGARGSTVMNAKADLIVIEKGALNSKVTGNLLECTGLNLPGLIDNGTNSFLLMNYKCNGGALISVPEKIPGLASAVGPKSISLVVTNGERGATDYQASKLMISTTTLPTVTLSTPVSFLFVAQGDSGGTLGWSAESLPKGLALDSNLGLLVGIPAAIGSQTFQLHVSNGVQTASTSLTLTVTNPVYLPLDALPEAIQNCSYATSLSASGGTLPYTWYVSGPLPSGLTLSSSGTLAGLLIDIRAAYPIPICVKDANGGRACATRTLQVRPALTLQSAALPSVEKNVPFAYRVSAEAAQGAPTFTAVGSLPSGITLEGDGLLSGRIQAAGIYSLIIQATDLIGQATAAEFRLAVR